jgi:outer membrane protein OmpA-like peptidoglycan-associated protein
MRRTLRPLTLVLALPALAVSAAGAAAPPAPRTLVATLRPAETLQSLGLGYHLAVSRDGSTIVATNMGPARVGQHPTVYVFERPSGGWSSVARFATLPSFAGPASPPAVAISANGDTVVIGNQSSAAYVFARPTTGWADATITSATATLTPSDANPVADAFGDAVAISGTTIAVGAQNLAVAGQGSAGAVDVYVRPPGGWVDATETAQLTSSAPTSGGSLGRKVAIDGDTIVASAQGSPTFPAAFVFVRPAGGWVAGTQAAKLTLPGFCQVGDVRGDVAVVGDTAVASACFQDPMTGLRAGDVRVFVRPPGGWADTSTASARLTQTPDAAPAQIHYGGALGFDGATIAVGGGATGGTSVWTYARPAGGWASAPETQSLAPPVDAAPDFGYKSLSVGAEALVVSTPSDVRDQFYVFAPVVVHAAVVAAPTPVVLAKGTTAFTATCTVDRGTARTCSVTARAPNGTVVASGSATPASAAAAIAVRLVVNAAGRKLLAKAHGHLDLAIRATVTPSAGAALVATTRDTLVARTVTITLAADILFPSGSATLTPAAIRAITKLGQQLTGSRAARCDGHTDSQGPDAANLALGLRRAKAVCTILHRYVRATTTRTFGERRPVATNATAAGRARNRRVEITVSN